MNIYLASSFLNKENARGAMKRLKKMGHKITADWTKHAPTNDIAKLRKEAEEDTEGVRRADALVVLWPGRLGTSAEIGIAVALRKPIFVLYAPIPEVRDPRLDSVYLNHPLVEFVSSFDELDLALRDLADDMEVGGIAPLEYTI